MEKGYNERENLKGQYNLQIENLKKAPPDHKFVFMKINFG